MTPPNPIRRPLGTAAACMVAVSLAGCHDASQDPLAVILAEETHAALAMRSGLPSLPGLAARMALEGGVAGAVDLWMESWEVEATRGRSLRRDAYDGAAEPLTQALGPDGVREVVEQVGEALDAVATLEPETLPDRLALDYGRVVGLHEEAVASLDGGALAPALARALEAADALREVGPHSVARSLVSQADAKLQAIRAGAAPGAGPEVGAAENVERAQRLVQGARLALEDEDWTRAVRRAYYACQLLGVAPR